MKLCGTVITIGLFVGCVQPNLRASSVLDSGTLPDPPMITAEVIITSGSQSSGPIPLTPLGAFLTATFSIPNLNGWAIGGLTAVDVPGNSGLSTNGLVTCAALPCPSAPLQIELSGTGFTLPVFQFQQSVSQTETNTGGTVVLNEQSFWDTSNALFGMTSPLPLITESCPSPPMTSSCATNGPLIPGLAGPSPYSLTLVQTLTQGAGLVSFSGSLVTSPIPEPSTWSMLGIGFAGMAAVAYRRRKSARAPNTAEHA